MKRRPSSSARKASVPKRKRVNALANPFRRLTGDLLGKIADYVYYAFGPKQLALMLVALGSDARCEDAITYYAVKISKRLAWSDEDAGADLARRRIVRDSLIRRLQNVSVERCLYCGKKQPRHGKNPMIQCGAEFSAMLGRPAEAVACYRCWVAHHREHLVDTDDRKCLCSREAASMSLTPCCERCVPGTVYGIERNWRLTSKSEAVGALARFCLLYPQFGRDCERHSAEGNHELAHAVRDTFVCSLRRTPRGLDSRSTVRAFLGQAKILAPFSMNDGAILGPWLQHAKEKLGVIVG